MAEDIKKQMEAFIYSCMVMPLSGMDDELIRQLLVPAPTFQNTRILNLAIIHPRPIVQPLGSRPHNYERDRAITKSLETSYLIGSSNNNPSSVLVGRFNRKHTTIVYKSNIQMLFSPVDKRKGNMFADIVENMLFDNLHTDKVLEAENKDLDNLTLIEFDTTHNYREIFSD